MYQLLVVIVVSPPETFRAVNELGGVGLSVSPCASIATEFSVTSCVPSPSKIACHLIPLVEIGKVGMLVSITAAEFELAVVEEVAHALPFQYFHVVPPSVDNL